ncbi:MAG: (2Fe-2S)-binding protein [Bacillota bacterium]
MGDEKAGGKPREAGKETVVICRCEDVTLDEIRDLITNGYTTMEEIKRITRCGMGPCQGRTCRQLVLAEIASATGKSIASVAPPRFRPPTKPIRLRGAIEGDRCD